MAKPAFHFQLQGFREVEAALRQLPKAASRTVLRRTLVKAARPIAAEASRLAPVGETGEYAKSITVGTKLTSGQEFGRVRQGSVEVFVGSGGPESRISHLLEFGTSKMAAQPHIRPAWEANERAFLANFRREIWKELEAAARRIAKQAERGKVGRATLRHFLGRQS